MLADWLKRGFKLIRVSLHRAVEDAPGGYIPGGYLLNSPAQTSYSLNVLISLKTRRIL